MVKILNSSAFHQPPNAVLIDMDNTLYAYSPAHHQAMQAVREKASKTFSITTETFDQAFAQAKDQTKQRLGKTAASHSRLLYFQRMLEIIGLGSQILLALDFEQTYWRTFLSHAKLFDEVKEFLDDLRLMGIPVALVTDLTAQIQCRKMVYFGLDRYIDHIVTSEEVGFDKPNPAPFRFAIEKLGITEHLWMIGDDANADVVGARNAIHAVTLQKLHADVEEGQKESLPDATFQEFSSLRKLLQKLHNSTKGS